MTPSDITAREAEEIDAANASGRTPVVFVHGLWLHATSWDRWREVFEAAGYATLAPGWPGDPETVDESRRRPEAFANKGVDEVTQHFAAIIERLETPPLLVGHSFGGLIVQKLLGLGLGAGAIAIDPAPYRGVFSLPVSALRATFPVLSHPSMRHGTVSLTEEQFRYAFANAVSEAEARDLYETYAIPASGRPLFQAATANLDPTSAASVMANPGRGPLLIVSGNYDNTVPPAVTHAEYARQKRTGATTELHDFGGRGHSLTIDGGWREIADDAINFAARHSIGP